LPPENQGYSRCCGAQFDLDCKLGGGEATGYVARHGQPNGRVAKLIIIAAVPPIMVKTAANPGGLPIEVFDGLRKQLADNRSQFYIDFPTGPFYGFNRAGAKPLQPIIQNWWRQGMMGGAKAHYDSIETTASRRSRRPTLPRI
jgi:non-heme chloroperoxidase